MITWIWIEGERALDEFCLRRFKCKPRWMETIGTLPGAKVRLIYKYVYKEDGETVARVAQMFCSTWTPPTTGARTWWEAACSPTLKE